MTRIVFCMVFRYSGFKTFWNLTIEKRYLCENNGKDFERVWNFTIEKRYLCETNGNYFE
ncbi:MAG: hypothetical protein PUC30_07280 [Lachnospiraceae bacterium]|nr:hypothetical protein [Lachnospiraceae bacterium]